MMLLVKWWGICVAAAILASGLQVLAIPGAQAQQVQLDSVGGTNDIPASAIGFYSARPPGPAMSPLPSFFVKIGAFLGAAKIIFALGYIIFKMVSASVSNAERWAKYIAISLGSILGFVLLTFSGIEHIFDFILLLGRPDGTFWLFAIIIIGAAISYLTSVSVKTLISNLQGIRVEVFVVAITSFILSLFSIWSIEQLISNPDSSRYLFSYLLTGILFGGMLFMINILILEAENGKVRRLR